MSLSDSALQDEISSIAARHLLTNLESRLSSGRVIGVCSAAKQATEPRRGEDRNCKKKRNNNVHHLHFGGCFCIRVRIGSARHMFSLTTPSPIAITSCVRLSLTCVVPCRTSSNSCFHPVGARKIRHCLSWGILRETPTNSPKPIPLKRVDPSIGYRAGHCSLDYVHLS